VVAGLVDRPGPDQTSLILAAPQGQALLQRDDAFDLIWVDVPEPDGSVDWFIERSQLTAKTLSDHLRSDGRPHVVEFQDFEALSWWPLPIARSSTSKPRIAIRVHGPVEMHGESMLRADIAPHPE
jgi:hypothetical protein